MILIGALCLLMLGGVTWNVVLGYAKDDARQRYAQEKRAEKARQKRQREELKASCQDKIVKLPIGVPPPQGLALMLTCDHVLHQPEVLFDDVGGAHMVACTCGDPEW